LGGKRRTKERVFGVLSPNLFNWGGPPPLINNIKEWRAFFWGDTPRVSLLTKNRRFLLFWGASREPHILRLNIGEFSTEGEFFYGPKRGVSEGVKYILSS